VVAGLPLMTGMSGALGVTTIAKVLSAALVVPSLTRMVMSEYVPTCAGLGVPDSSPVAVLNVAQIGRFGPDLMEKFFVKNAKVLFPA